MKDGMDTQIAEADVGNKTLNYSEKTEDGGPIERRDPLSADH